MVETILKFSSTRAWFNIGNAAITFAYLWHQVHSGDFVTDTIVFGGLISGSKVAEKFMGYRWGANASKPTTP